MNAEQSVEEFIRERIAEALTERGALWNLVHCGLCGVPLPQADHECEDKPWDLQGITSI